jgi:hypothetical protein
VNMFFTDARRNILILRNWFHQSFTTILMSAMGITQISAVWQAMVKVRNYYVGRNLDGGMRLTDLIWLKRQ